MQTFVYDTGSRKASPKSSLLIALIKLKSCFFFKMMLPLQKRIWTIDDTYDFFSQIYFWNLLQIRYFSGSIVVTFNTISVVKIHFLQKCWYEPYSSNFLLKTDICKKKTYSLHFTPAASLLLFSFLSLSNLFLDFWVNSFFSPAEAGGFSSLSTQRDFLFGPSQPPIPPSHTRESNLALSENWYFLSFPFQYFWPVHYRPDDLLPLSHVVFIAMFQKTTATSLKLFLVFVFFGIGPAPPSPAPPFYFND